MRAVRILKEVDYIAAEDTRHSRILLSKYEIGTPVLSYHSYSGEGKVEKIVEILKSGRSVALISDAGTPGISDPAYTLVRRVLEEGIKVVPVPGASSLLAALVMSGLPMNQFVYLGFLPLKKGRQTLLKKLAGEERTMVIFESPHRLLRSLGEFCEYFGGDRLVAICRELTKIYEECLRMTLSEAVEYFGKNKPRGEFVVIVGGAE